MPFVPDQLSRSTVRLKCSNGNGNTSIGTSFYVNVTESAEKNFPVLVTNRHVVSGFTSVELSFSTSPDPRLATPIDKKSIFFNKLNEVVFYHPDDSVDLALILLGPILNSDANHGATINLTPIPLDKFVSADLERDMSFAEDVLVIGYPQGIWDSTRNLPIVRKGITASPSMIDYEETSRFLIDCSIFPGSSGSPVFLYNYPTYVENGKIEFGTRWCLLGVISSVHLFEASGNVTEAPAPVAINDKIVARIPNNLGIAIKAREVVIMLDALARLL
jgi:hypothetical protein